MPPPVDLWRSGSIALDVVLAARAPAAAIAARQARRLGELLGGARGGIGALKPQRGAGSSRSEDNRRLKTPPRGRRHWELM